MLPLLLALQSLSTDPPPTYNGLAKELSAAIPRLEAEAVVDGALDEPVWRRAARLVGFSQYRPVDGRPAEDSTEVLVWYAPDAMWFGIRAFEGHGGSAVRATLADRDNIGADDNVQILLDTFEDHRRALLFAVNPLGVQEDGVRSEGQDAGAAGGGASTAARFDGVVDLSPDFVYHSHGRVTPDGYEVEVRIPFKSLRYQSADPQNWGLQVVRVIQHSGYENTWTPVFRASASFLIQSGRLVGLTGLKRGVVLDLTPEFTSKVDGRPQGAGYDYRGTPELGGNLRWGISQNLNLTATAHPDFSQVEADVGQVTVNERFALFYPEKRPFFLEGLEQFDTPNRLIYTRQIVSPVAGGKLTGKVGGTDVAYLAAVDERAQSAAGDNPVVNILRLRRDLGASSTAGLAYTDRIEGDAYNRVLGADALVVWKKIWYSQAQLVGAWTRDGVGARTGQFWTITFADRTGRSYGNHYELLGATPDFEARSGFINRVDFVQGRAFNRFTWYGKPAALVEQVTTFTGWSPLWKYDEFFRLSGTFEGGPETTWFATLRGGWNLNAHAQVVMQRFDRAAYAGYGVDRTVDTIPFAVPRGLYNLWSGYVAASTPNRSLTLSTTLGYGATALFAEAAKGRQLSVQATATWKPTPGARVEARWVHVRLARARDGSRFSTANIPRLKLEYQLSRATFFRYVGQYFAQDQVALEDPRTGQPLLVDGTAGGPAVTNDFRNDFLFSYKPTPGTVLFVGYGTSLSEPDAFRFRDLTRTNDGFFLKVSYLFRM
ncbi:MAG TPA: DUF5916 domain-containing protein [Gemmatimonadales bacterium]|nr:DUF5916 domain-containing protein [Gemmatimonadales bacterium]